MKTLPRVVSTSFFLSFLRNFEPTPGDTRNDLEPRRIIWVTLLHAERTKVLYAGYLVAGGAVIFSKLRFDDDLRIELIGNDKICA